MIKLSLFCIISVWLHGQIDTLSTDSIFEARFNLFINQNYSNEFKLTYKDSMRAIWKSTFRTQPEVGALSEHLKNPRYERNFIGINLFRVFSSFAEWIGLKENTKDKYENTLDEYEKELYNEFQWEIEQQRLLKGNYPRKK